MNRKLHRNEQNKMIAGVCAGLADYFSVDVSWVRIAFLFAFLAGCSGGLIYVILWVAVPYDPIRITPVDHSDHSNPEVVPMSSNKSKRISSGRSVFGLFLIAFGAFLLLDEFGIIPFWFEIGRFWPLLLIIPGFLLLAKSKREKSADNEPIHRGNEDQPEQGV